MRGKPVVILCFTWLSQLSLSLECIYSNWHEIEYMFKPGPTDHSYINPLDQSSPVAEPEAGSSLWRQGLRQRTTPLCIACSPSNSKLTVLLPHAALLCSLLALFDLLLTSQGDILCFSGNQIRNQFPGFWLLWLAYYWIRSSHVAFFLIES